jgi:hypothetical protein
LIQGTDGLAEPGPELGSPVVIVVFVAAAATADGADADRVGEAALFRPADGVEWGRTLDLAIALMCWRLRPSSNPSALASACQCLTRSPSLAVSTTRRPRSQHGLPIGNPDDRPIVHPRVRPESDCLWSKLSAAGHNPDEISAAEYLDENAHQGWCAFTKNQQSRIAIDCD